MFLQHLANNPPLAFHMSSAPIPSPQNPDLPGAEYAWELATLFPAQGDWTEEAYLDLTNGSNRRIELTAGKLDFIEMPTLIHETLVQYLLFALYGFVDQRKMGSVFNNGIRLRIRPSRVRLPDIIFLHKDNFHARHNRVWDGADLVMEVVSDDPKDRRRDYEEKLSDYAEGGIAEYWIVDYERKLVIVHQLEAGSYVVQGEYTLGQQAASVLLDGFSVDVTKLFASADDVPE